MYPRKNIRSVINLKEALITWLFIVCHLLFMSIMSKDFEIYSISLFHIGLQKKVYFLSNLFSKQKQVKHKNMKSKTWFLFEQKSWLQVRFSWDEFNGWLNLTMLRRRWIEFFTSPLVITILIRFETGTRLTRQLWKRFRQLVSPDWLRRWPTTIPSSTSTSLTGSINLSLLT